MSLRDCIQSKAAQGLVDPEQAQETVDLYDQLADEYARRMDPRVAQRQAAKDAAAAVRRATLEKKRQTLLQARAQQKMLADLDAYRDAGGGEDYPGAGLAMLDRDDLAPYDNVKFRHQAVRGLALSRMTGVLESFRRNLAGGPRNKALQRNLTREAFGMDTGDAAAKQLNEAWQEAAEYLRTRFNSSGGRIPKRQDWGMPTVHNPRAVMRAGFDEWRAVIRPLLDREKMIDEQTGLPMSEARLEQALEAVHETIATDGLSKMNPSGAAFGRSIANRHVDHRFLAFRDGDAWLQYQEAFGNPQPFDTMMAHVVSMSREIAAMERFGPNPRASLRWLQQSIKRRGAERARQTGEQRFKSRANRAAAQIDADWAHFSTANESPVHEGMASFFAGTRSGLSAAFLGSAQLSAITDVGFQRIAARYNGLNQARTIGRILRYLSPIVNEDQRIAARSGIIAENWTQMAAAQARYVGEVAGPEFMRRLSDATLRLSGLSPWTMYGKMSFGMEFMATLGERVGRQWDELEPALRTGLERHGWGPKSWDTLRNTPLFEKDGAVFLRPTEVEARTDLPEGSARDLATRMLAMITEETETFAVPTSSQRGRAFVMGETRPGSTLGEVGRSGFMFKNFPTTILMGHVMRVAGQKGVRNKLSYGADLAITTTLMGALALQLKEISKGRNPRPMFGDNAGKFWGAAQLQGGGLGIFGDFLFGDVNRFGRSLGMTLAGPVVQFGDDVNNLVTGNLLELAQGEETDFGRELVHFMRSYTPGGSIWYIRQLYERQMLDRLEEMADPKAHRSRMRLRRRYLRDYGQDYWWRPGQRAPERPPDLGEAMEAPQR